MTKSKLDAAFEGDKYNLKILIELFTWEEDGDHYVYSPALDLIGSGDSEEEAKESFKIVLEEYVRYTHNKGTLFDDLEEHGWFINRQKRKVKAPSIEDMEEDRETFRDILSSGSYQREEREVQLA